MKNLVTSTLVGTIAAFCAAGAAFAGAPGARPGDTTAAHVAVPPASHGLPPAKKCALKGTWTNDYGATITMTSNKKGTYVASYCGSPWKVKTTSRTKAGFSVALTYTGDDGCTGFTEDMTWDGSCTEASGTFTDPDGGQGPDDWYAADAPRHTAPATGTIAKGLK